MQKVVVSVDGSEASRAGVQWCAENVDRSARVIAVGALAEMGEFVVDLPGLGTSSRDVRDTFYHSWCAPLEAAGLDWTAVFSTRTQAAAVAETVDAERPDLVIVGKPAHVTADLLLGGQLHHVLHRATCPVLLVPVAA